MVRQNFYPEDLGKYKAVALAERLSRKFDRPISYCTLTVGEIYIPQTSILIGCVDNGIARRQISERVKNLECWWVDAGNGTNYAQVLIGNNSLAKFVTRTRLAENAEFNTTTEIAESLPYPSIQRPEILLQAPEPATPNCIDIDSQGPTINQVVAALTIEVVNRLIQGTCPWMQLMVDMDKGTMQPVMADPKILKNMFKKKIKIIEEEN